MAEEGKRMREVIRYGRMCDNHHFFYFEALDGDFANVARALAYKDMTKWDRTKVS